MDKAVIPSRHSAILQTTWTKSAYLVYYHQNPGRNNSSDFIYVRDTFCTTICFYIHQIYEMKLCNKIINHCLMKNYHTPLWSIKSLSSSVSPKSEMPGRKRNQMHPVHMRVELFPHTSSPSGSGATVSRAVKRKHPGVCCVFACLLRRHCQGALHNSGDHRDF